MDECCFSCKAKLETDDPPSFTERLLCCTECNAPSHVQCLPISRLSHLKGDVLFNVVCPSCSDDKDVHLERMRVSWLQAIHLALYNLSIRESGRQGFFRWRDDICSFIEKHWSVLLPDKVKTNNWTSTIAGTLSVNCPKLFKSGQQDFKEPGWWALQVRKPPPRSYDESIIKRPKNKPLQSDTRDSMLTDVGLGRGRRKRKIISYKHDSHRTAKASLTEETKKEGRKEEPKEEAKLGMYHVESSEPELLKIVIKREETTDDTADLPLGEPDAKFDSEFLGDLCGNDVGYSKLSGDFLSFEDSCALIDTEEFSRVLSSEKLSEYDSEVNSLGDDGLGIIRHSSLMKGLEDGVNEARKHIPITKLKSSEIVEKENVSLVPMTPKQEFEFLKEIEKFPDVLASDPLTRRLRRQLLLRKRKRELGLPLFDLDKFVFDSIKKTAPPEVEDRLVRDIKESVDDTPTERHLSGKPNSYHHPALSGVSILDRFFSSVKQVQNVIEEKTQYRTFKSRLVGRGHELYSRSVISPYTGRVLKPYIRRDFECCPPKAQILRELLNYTHRYDCHWVSPCRTAIDYCYVQLEHIPAINAMCKEFFWPGIDMTECLQYPDFSCVALYKKIIIGFAFLVPDVRYNEAYISFILVHPDWRRAGIATFFIYHLIQTCMGKDITLHVSASNPSMLLYQKFGFKVEELVLNFYDRYLPEESKESRHAFFLRLQR